MAFFLLYVWCGRKRIANFAPRMSVSVPYIIDLLALRGNAESRHYVLDNVFFSSLEGSHIDGGDVVADVVVMPHGGSYNLHVAVEGEVRVSCDRCLEPMDIAIQGEDSIKVVLGDADSDDGETVTVDQTRGTLDVSWHIYETVALQIPLMHAHLDGECNQAMARLLGSMMVQADNTED